MTAFASLATAAMFSLLSTPYVYNENTLVKIASSALGIPITDTFFRVIKSYLKYLQEIKTSKSLALRRLITGFLSCATLTGAILATGGGDSNSTMMLALLCQEMAGLLKIMTKDIPQTQLLVSLLLVVSLLGALNVARIFNEKAYASIPKEALACLCVVVATCLSILFYHFKRAVRPEKIKEPKLAVKKPKAPKAQSSV